MTKIERAFLKGEFMLARDRMLKELRENSTQHFYNLIYDDSGLTYDDLVERCLTVGIVKAVSYKYECRSDHSARLATALLEYLNANWYRHQTVPLQLPPEDKNETI
jgi:hypothetical protein